MKRSEIDRRQEDRRKGYDPAAVDKLGSIERRKTERRIRPEKREGWVRVEGGWVSVMVDRGRLLDLRMF